MVQDHTAVNKQALDLVKKLGVTPEDNDISNKAAAAKNDELAKLSGATFDKAYVDNEVAYHKTVNDALRSTLIPSASNAELKSLLQTGLKIFQGHQEHAADAPSTPASPPRRVSSRTSTPSTPSARPAKPLSKASGMRDGG